MKHILITGATGLVGSALTKLLLQRGYTVKSLSTNRKITDGKTIFFWAPKYKVIDESVWENVEGIIHLAGANIGEKRWTEKRKQEIIDSRVMSTEFLFQQVHSFNVPLKVFVSASAEGYYGAITNDRIYTEDDPSFHDFLGETCQKWENAAKLFGRIGIRTVKIRTALVLSKDSTALHKMSIPVKLGLGSPLGSGRQYVPWIHLEDLCNIYLKAIADENMHGAYNAVSPEFITNRDFMKTLAETHRKPFFFPAVPASLISLVMGEMSDLVLEGSRVSPKRLTEAKFKFRYENLKSALAEIYPK